MEKVGLLRNKGFPLCRLVGVIKAMVPSGSHAAPLPRERGWTSKKHGEQYLILGPLLGLVDVKSRTKFLLADMELHTILSVSPFRDNTAVVLTLKLHTRSRM
jgi:hypothetical protein